VSDRPVPVEIRAPRGARVMEIDWADGLRGRVRHRILRGFCPCAECQGHEGPIELVEVEGAGLDLVAIEEVGQYALSLAWGDGHRTGIYSFEHLRKLCELPPEGDLANRTIPR
jgi:DUF971 family protein